MKRITMISAAAALLLAAAVAGAKPHGEHGQGQGSDKPKGVAYVFKGAYVDATTVDVVKGNKHVRNAELSGPVSFDFSAAKVVVADTNGDGAATIDDVVAGDKVVVKVKAPRSDPGAQPFAARQLVDQTHPATED